MDKQSAIRIISGKLTEASVLIAECRQLAADNDVSLSGDISYAITEGLSLDQDWQSSEVCW